MGYASRYAELEPMRQEIDGFEAALVEFGSPDCGYCLAAQPLIEDACARHPDILHIKIADGRGRPLGRSFGVKLWPTLIFLRAGKEIERLIRPRDLAAIEGALGRIDTPL